MTDIEKLVERVEVQAEMIQVWSPLIDRMEAAGKKMIAAYDAWDAAEREPYSREVWGKRVRLCGEFLEAKKEAGEVFGGVTMGVARPGMHEVEG